MAETEGFDINQKSALVAIDDEGRRATVTDALHELGFRVQAAESAEDGYDKLRKTAFEAVVVDQGFQGGTLLDNPLLKHLQWMPANTRRYMFLALLAPDVKTLDNMSAFAASVNAVVNYNDMAQSKAILERGIVENDQFFRVLRTVLQEAGRR